MGCLRKSARTQSSTCSMAIEQAEDWVLALFRKQPIRDHRQSKAQLACALHDDRKRRIEQWLPARKADQRVPLGSEQFQGIAEHRRIEFPSALRIRLRIAMHAREVAQPGGMQVNGAIREEPGPHHSVLV